MNNFLALFYIRLLMYKIYKTEKTTYGGNASQSHCINRTEEWKLVLINKFDNLTDAMNKMRELTITDYEYTKWHYDNPDYIDNFINNKFLKHIKKYNMLSPIETTNDLRNEICKLLNKDGIETELI